MVPNAVYTTDSNGKFTYTIDTGAADCTPTLGTYNVSNYTFTFTLYAIDNRSVSGRSFYAYLVVFQQFS